MASENVIPSEQPGDYTPDGPDAVQTYCPLPEGSIPLFAVEICEYLTEDGSRGWVVRYPLNSTYSTVIGLLEMGKFQVLQEYAAGTAEIGNDEDGAVDG